MYVFTYLLNYVYVFYAISTLLSTDATVNHCNINIIITIVGFAVIEGPPVIIFRPNEGPVELICNASSSVIAWIMNNSSDTLPSAVAMQFPGHGVNGDNLVIIDPTNNTEYICVSVEGGGVTIESDPVVLYLAGMLYHYNFSIGRHMVLGFFSV